MPEDEADDGREDSALLEVKGQLECCLAEAKQKDKQITDLEQECHRLQVCIQDLKSNLEEGVSQEHILKENTCQTTLETKQMATAVDFSNLNIAGAFAAKSQMAKQDLELREKNKHILTLEKEIALLKQKAEYASDYEDLKKLNSELQAEVTSLFKVKVELEEKVICLQKEKEGLKDKEVGLTNPNALGSKSKETDSQTHVMLSEKEAELAQKENALTLKETQLLALQKNLKQTQEHLEEEEAQAVQEARRREVERRREILAVAEEAIAQKDAELQKRQEEISRSVICLVNISTIF